MKDSGAPLDGPVAKLLDQNSPRYTVVQLLSRSQGGEYFAAQQLY